MKQNRPANIWSYIWYQTTVEVAIIYGLFIGVCRHIWSPLWPIFHSTLVPSVRKIGLISFITFSTNSYRVSLPRLTAFDRNRLEGTAVHRGKTVIYVVFGSLSEFNI